MPLVQELVKMDQLAKETSLYTNAYRHKEECVFSRHYIWQLFHIIFFQIINRKKFCKVVHIKICLFHVVCLCLAMVVWVWTGRYSHSAVWIFNSLSCEQKENWLPEACSRYAEKIKQFSINRAASTGQGDKHFCMLWLLSDLLVLHNLLPYT